MRLSNTSIRLTFIVLVVFLFSSLYASETRVATMGGGGIFLKDQSNVFLFPGTMLEYPDLVVTEMRARGSDAFYSIGLHLNYDNMVSGLYVNQPINSLALFQGLGLLGSATPINNAFAYLLGMKLGGMNAGFGFIGAATSYENNTNPKHEESATYMGFLAGVSNNMMDLGLLFELPSVTIKNPDADYSGFALQANGRYYLMKRHGFNIFPVATIAFGSTKIKNNVDYSLFGIALGIGVEKEINENNLLVVGLEASRYATTSDFSGGGPQVTNSTLTLPGIYIGVESKISSWLIGRIGATQVNQIKGTTTDPEATSDGTNTTSQFLMSLGLGMEFSDFLIDFNFNENTLFDGIYIFNGAGGGQFASTVSITYNFGGGDDK